MNLTQRYLTAKQLPVMLEIMNMFDPYNDKAMVEFFERQTIPSSTSRTLKSVRCAVDNRIHARIVTRMARPTFSRGKRGTAGTMIFNQMIMGEFML